MKFIVFLALLIPALAIAQETPGVNAFGDSITYPGDGVATPSTQAYAYLMAPSFGGTFTNYGNSGDEAADMDIRVYGDIANTGSVPAATMLIGTNDANHTGTGTNKEFIFNRVLLSAIAWAAIPRTSKVYAQDAGCTAVGTWSNFNSVVSGMGKQSNTNGDTLSCVVPVNSSGILYANWYVNDGTGGTVSVKIDGSTPGNDSSLASTGPGGQCICTQNSTTAAPFLARYTGLSQGNHTILFTVTSATGSDNPNYILWMGSPFTTSNSTPRVYVGGVIPQQNDTDSSATAQYNSDVVSDVSTLDSDGLPVTFVDVRSWINSGNDFNGGTVTPPPIPGTSMCTVSTGNPLHPGTCGMAHLALAFESYLTLGMASISNATLSNATIQ